MKPILFNTEMVRGVDAGIKTVTRRVVKPQPCAECDHGGQHEFIRDDFTEGSSFTGFVCKKCGYGVCGPHFKFPVGTSWLRPPYRPGDILYVRETWYYESFYEDNDAIPADLPSGRCTWRYEYKATSPDYPVAPGHWHPSIHMPEEAARLFLRVTGLKAQHVQDITDEEARREGCAGRADFHRVWNGCYAKPRPVKGEDGKIDHYESWPWEDIRETRTHRGKPWHVIGNPWVWVIEFKRITREEAEKQ